MAFKHGSKAIFKLDATLGGLLTDISTYVLGITFSPEVDSAETSTLGTTAKTYVTGLRDATLSLEGRFDPTVDAIFDGALSDGGGGASNTTRTWEYGPQGTSSGSRMYTGEGLVTSYEVETPLDDVGAWSAEIQVTGTYTRSTY